MANGFKEILFPSAISYGSSGGAKFKTTVFTADSGYEQRNIDWSNIRCEFDASHGIKDQFQMEELTTFFMVVGGRANGFRYLDWNDYKIKNQLIGVGDDPGDGSGTKVFQLSKTYTFTQEESGETGTYTRNITKPVWGTIAGVTVGGVIVTQIPDPTTGQAWSMDFTTGIMSFVNAPANTDAVVVGAGEFHVPVRFDTDHLDVTQEYWNTTSWNSIPIVEVREWGEALA